MFKRRYDIICSDVMQGEVMLVLYTNYDVIFNADDGRRHPRLNICCISAHDSSRGGAIGNVLESGGEMSTTTP